ncbi:hypothetical protein [Bacteroides sp. 51]|uniref:hypothetical protein n=1 Tax=Bacteroides sp. 51 TaxID=2302938 RepID=UPI0013D1C89F|nr:hypothetical protein [Bacteroides sp. 51]NDV83757.1 hypothetical protein [Bacteroides sp. 51]
MKRTTYIMIGIFLGSLVLSIASLIYLRSTFVNYDETIGKVDFSSEYTNMDFEDIHTLKVLVPARHSGNNNIIASGMVDINPSSVENKTTIFYPISDYVKLSKKNGVLEVEVTAHPDSLKRENSFIERISLENLHLQVESGKGLKRVIVDWGMGLSIHQMELKELDIVSYSTKLDSCIIDSLSVSVDGFECNKTTINTLRLEKIGWNKFDNSEIATLHIIGRGEHHYYVPDGNFGRILWEPKDEKARLELKLRNKAEIIMDNN